MPVEIKHSSESSGNSWIDVSSQGINGLVPIKSGIVGFGLIKSGIVGLGLIELIITASNRTSV